MDRFTRNYSIVLAVLVIALLVWALYENPHVSILNRQLEGDPDLASYPYPFRVLSIHNGTAVVGSPRSVEFPAFRALGVLFPRLAGRPPDDPDLMRAQQRLAQMQQKARAIIMASPRIKSVQWQLDRDWLTRHGVQLNLNQTSSPISSYSSAVA